MQKPSQGRRLLIELVDSCAERAWRVAMSYLRDEHAAFDAVQQAFLVATKKQDQIPARNSWPWFSVVVANEARNMRRKKRPTPIEKEELSAATPDSDTPESHLFAEESMADLDAALASLPEDERDAISLTMLGGMTQKAAAEALGVPRKTLASRIERGIKKMRQKLGQDEKQISSLLAVAPIAAPIGGFGPALSIWKSATLKVASTTISHAALTGAGVTAMTKSFITSIVLTLLLVGTYGWLLMDANFEDNPSADAVGEKTQQDRANKVSPDERSAKMAVKKSNAAKPKIDIKKSPEFLSLKKSHDQLYEKHQGSDEEIAALKRERDALLDELEPYRKAKIAAYPTFTFGSGGKLNGVLEQNWKGYAYAAATMNKLMAERRAARLAGEPFPAESQIAMQRNTERMRQYEYQVWGKMPSAAAQNRETTHPITISNMLAAHLREAGVPLSEDQVAKIERLGENWDRDFTAMRANYTESTLRARKMVDEIRSKGKFGDDLIAMLSPEQRNLIVNPETWRRAYIDLYCPTLMVIHSTPVIPRKSVKEVETKIIDILAKGYSNGRIFSFPGAMLDEEQVKKLKPLVTEFMRKCVKTTQPVARSSVMNYRFEEALEFGEATVWLYQAMVSELMLSVDQTEALRKTPMLLAPRILAGD